MIKGLADKLRSQERVVDFSKFNTNNWLKVDKNITLNHISRSGGAIWLNTSGELCYRFLDGGIVTINSISKTNIVFTNFLDTDIKFLVGTKEHQADVTAREMRLIQGDEFRPTILKEFYEHKALWYRNLFEPSQFLKMKPQEHKEPKAILSLIGNVVNGDKERAYYLINWLAYFFQGLKKSQVAMVLRGNQGAGKGILFENIITPLFGSKYCIQINDKAFKSDKNGSMFDNRLFFNLDEISHDMKGNKDAKNFLKALVTSDSVTLEKKFINIEGRTKIHGQVLITSNEPYVLEIEVSDRRYTIFSTGDNLTKVDYLGFGNYKNLARCIKSELKDFAIYLKNFNVDVALANEALETPEKKALVNATNDRFKLLTKSIETKEVNFFSSIEDYSDSLYNTLLNDFSKDRILKKNLKYYYSALYSEEISTQTLISKLRIISPMLFDDDNLISSNGQKYYKIG